MFNEENYEELQIYEYIEEYQSDSNAVNEEDNTPVCYLYNGGITLIDLIQFAMQEESITVIKEKEIVKGEDGRKALYACLPDEGVLIVDTSSSYRKELENSFKKCVETNDFILLFIETTDSRMGIQKDEIDYSNSMLQ